VTMTTLHVLSAGAAKGLVGAIAPVFRGATGAAIDGTFGAVGAIREKLLAGAPCDLVVLTAAMLAELARDGRIDGSSVRPLGRVRTGIAVRTRDARPSVRSADELRAALDAADAIFLPDPERATAGIHFMKVLRSLGLEPRLAERLRPHPNGAAAMTALAASSDARPIGCTQVTEIRYTEGVALVDVLPPEFELATVYSAGVAVGAAHPDLAGSLVAMLAGPDAAAIRAAGGFEETPDGVARKGNPNG
jgi:molybdate transport system substrate-binding protein